VSKFAEGQRRWRDAAARFAFRASRSLLLGEEAASLVGYEQSISQRCLLCATTMSPRFSINPQRRFVTKPGPGK